MRLTHDDKFRKVKGKESPFVDSDSVVEADPKQEQRAQECHLLNGMNKKCQVRWNRLMTD